MSRPGKHVRSMGRKPFTSAPQPQEGTREAHWGPRRIPAARWGLEVLFLQATSPGAKVAVGACEPRRRPSRRPISNVGKQYTMWGKCAGTLPSSTMPGCLDAEHTCRCNWDAHGDFEWSACPGGGWLFRGLGQRQMQQWAAVSAGHELLIRKVGWVPTS